MSSNAGTYIITIHAFIDVITGVTTVSGLAGAYSTSSTAFTQPIGARNDGGAFT